METSGDAVEDARLRQLAWPIAGATALGTLTALTTAAATAGLAAYLAGGLQGIGESLGSNSWLARPWTVFAFTLATLLLSVANTLVREYLTTTWEAARRADLVDAYAGATFSAQASYSAAELTVGSEQVAAASTTIGALIGLINSAVATAIFLGAALIASWQIAVVALLLGGGLVSGLRLVSLRTRKLVRRSAAMSVEIGESLGSMAESSRELHALDRWGGAIQRTKKQVDEVRHLRFTSRSLATMVGPFFLFGTGLVGLSVGWINQRGPGVDVPSLAAAGLLLIRGLGAAQSCQTLYQQFNDSVPYVDRVLGLIAKLRGLQRQGHGHLAGGMPTLRLNAVTLSHGNDEVVHGVTQTFDGVGGIAIVGESGSGKSTTLSALAGLIVPTAGRVELSGSSLNDLDRRELSQRVGLLPQDPKLLQASLRHNLLRADREVTDHELLTLLAQLRLDVTVAGFSDGLNTKMGRNQEGLSGGELQRIGLARLILNGPEVWLLDEPTSALDRANSEVVTRQIIEAMSTRLVILVTHRPELLSHCKEVVLMSDGRVVDSGALQDVIERQEFVASMLGQEYVIGGEQE